VSLGEECLRGIRIRVVLPSTIDTPIYQHAGNLTGRHVHPLPPRVSPRRVARAIVRSPERRRFATFVGQVQRSTVLLHRVSAPAYDALTTFMLDNVELRGNGAPLTNGTVFEPPADAEPVTGGWRTPRRRILGLAVLGAGAAAVAVSRRAGTQR